ncbi:unnamed protein product, partial [Oppiella nova]
MFLRHRHITATALYSTQCTHKLRVDAPTPSQNVKYSDKPNKGSPPAIGTSRSPPDAAHSPPVMEDQLKTPPDKPMDCFIAIEKLSLDQTCRKYNIDYQLLKKDYDLYDDKQILKNDKQSLRNSQKNASRRAVDVSVTRDDDMSGQTVDGHADDDLEDYYESEHWEDLNDTSANYILRERTSKRKKSSKKFDSKGRPSKKAKTSPNATKTSDPLTSQQLAINSSQRKPNAKQTKNGTNKSTKNGGNGFENEFSVFCSASQTASPPLSRNGSAGASTSTPVHHKPMRSKPYHSYSSPKTSLNKVVKNKHKRLKKDRFPDDHIINFLGERFRANDLLYKHCMCENDCEADELSLAFYLMCNVPDNELPRHLDIAVNGGDTELLSESDDPDLTGPESDPNLSNFLPNEEDIYKQTFVDDFINSGVDEFLKKSSLIPSATVTSAVGAPLIDPSMPSTLEIDFYYICDDFMPDDYYYYSHSCNDMLDTNVASLELIFVIMQLCVSFDWESCLRIDEMFVMFVMLCEICWTQMSRELKSQNKGTRMRHKLPALNPNLSINISDSNNNSIEKSAQKVMSNTSGSESLSSPEEDGYEEDECDHQSARDDPKRDELRKQFCDVLNWTSPSALSTCSMSSSSVCCSPASTRMSSPSPTCMTPTGGLCSGNGQHSPSTLSSIREAVSHLT